MSLQSVELNGTNQYLQRSMNALTGFSGKSSDDITITASIKTTSSARQDIVSFGNGGGVFKHFDFFVWTNGSVALFLDDGSQTYFYNPGVITINDGEWHEVSFTYERSTRNVKIYVDGVQNGTTGTATANIDDLWDLNSSNFVVIGARYNGSFLGFYNGRISNVRAFNTVLTLSDINLEHGSLTPLDASCYFSIPLNGDATDNSGNGNDLTNNNGATFVDDNPITEAVTTSNNFLGFSRL